MPSMFEPCGLSQMISLRYGTLPVVRETGGLRDTVLSYNEYTGEGNGFTFLNYNAHDMLHVVQRAEDMYRRHKNDVWDMLVKRAMAGHYGWDASAQHYIDLYYEVAGIVRPEEAPPAKVTLESEEKPKTPRKPRAKKPAAEKDAAPAEKKPRAPRKKKTEA